MYTSRANATRAWTSRLPEHLLSADREEIEVREPEGGGDKQTEDRRDDLAQADAGPGRADPDGDEGLAQRNDEHEAVPLGEVPRVHSPARRPCPSSAAVGDGDRGDPDPRARAVREARDENQCRADEGPRRKPKHGLEQIGIPAPGERIQARVHRADDEECCAEKHALVPEHARDDERSDEHRDQRDQQGRADELLLGVDIVREPGVCRPGPPQRGEDEDAPADPGERRVVGEQRRDLREREDEDEIEEELPRGDAVLLVDSRDAHPCPRLTQRFARPDSGASRTRTGGLLGAISPGRLAARCGASLSA